MLNFLGLALICLLSWLLTKEIRRFALHKKVMDIPNQRSSHKVPVPKSGGLAFIISFYAGLSMLVFTETSTLYLTLPIMGITFLVAGIGLVDDLHPLSARTRLLIHFIAAAALIVLFQGLPPIQFFNNTLWPGPWADIAAVVGIVWILNLYNFMDGIDGLAAIQAITVGIGMAAIAFLQGDTFHLWPILMLVGAVTGFLAWNFPPARIFMGDVGSGFLGLVLCALGLYLMKLHLITFWAFLILMNVFLIDATYTLVRRILQSETLSQAHRRHAYQKAALKFGHKPVSLGAGLINLLWLAPLAILAALFPFFGALLFVVSALPLLAVAIYFKAGQAD